MLPKRATLPVVALLVCAGTVAAQPKDRLGDSLPAGALVRIGTTRLQLDREIEACAVSPDGKRIAAVSDSTLGVWETAGGKQVLRSPWPRGDDGGPRVVAFTPDGKSLVCNTPNGEKLCVLDIAAGTTSPLPTQDVYWWHIARNGKTAMSAESATDSVEYTLEIRDLPGAKLRQRWVFVPDPTLRQSMTANYWVEFCLSADGKLLATRESNRQRKLQMIRLHDAATGAELCRWSLELPLVRQLAFSADNKLLVGASADGADSNVRAGDSAGAGKREAIARVWDVATGKEVARWKIGGGVNSGLFDVTFAPDGASVFTTEAAGSVRWDWHSGKRLQDYPDVGGPFVFLDGGKTLAVQGPLGAIRLLDVATGVDRCPLPHAGKHVALAPDARHIAWSDGGAIVLTDAATGNEIRRWPAHERFVGPLAFAPDGKLLASAGTDMRIRLWGVPDGKERPSLVRIGVNRLSFARDGRRLISAGNWDMCLWDLGTGKRIGMWYGTGAAPVMAPSLEAVAVPNHSSRRLRLIEPTTGKDLHTVTGYRSVVAYDKYRETTFAPLFSPDGRMVLAGARSDDSDFDLIQAWNTASGKPLPFVLHGARVMLNHVAFSPDSRLLAVMRADGRLVLLSAATGAVVRLLGIGPEPLSAAPVFTPDGRTVITACGKALQFWEVATGSEIVRRTGHADSLNELTLSANGRLLASRSADRTTLVWDLAHLTTGAAPAPEMLWADLASTDAQRGRRAVEALLAAPAAALALLGKQMPPAVPPDPKLLARWLTDLGSDDFDERQQAEQGLDRLGELAATALRQALSAKPPFEARRRMEDLLRKLDGPGHSPAQIRAVRGVQVLEGLADPEARRLLAVLARGAPESRVTLEAAAALERLGK